MNMKKLVNTTILISILLVLLTGMVFAQDSFHLSDITKIIHKSGKYDVHISYFDKEIETKKIRDLYRQNNPNQYLNIKDGKKEVKIFEVPDEVKTTIKKAEELIEKNKPGKAEKLLKEAGEKCPGYSHIPVLLAKIKINEKKYDESITLLDEAIKINPIDFTAYKLRGDCYFEKGENQKALDEYIMAIINNRNYDEAKKALDKTANKMGLKVNDQPFVPLYSIQDLKNGKYRVYYDDNEKIRWMPYSYTKAVWQCEPEYYKRQTGKDKYEWTYKEEEECIKNTIWGYGAFVRQGNFDKDPFLERLKEIKSRFFIREFIIFEIMSPQKPEMLLTMDDKYLNDLKDYINEFILVKKQ